MTSRIDILSMVELSLAIVVASLPGLKPLFADVHASTSSGDITERWKEIDV